jgi:5-formyltetrahydrofolate cyclo-ligase
MHGDHDRDLLRQAKSVLRKQMRGLRATFPARLLGDRARKIGENVLAMRAYARAHAIVLSAVPSGQTGVDTTWLASQARAAGKVVAYPRVDLEAQRVQFHVVQDESQLQSRGLATAEAPAHCVCLSPDATTLLVVPVLAVDPTGVFLGDGSGCYDHAMRCSPDLVSVALAYSFQLIPEAPRDADDALVAWIATEDRVIAARASSADASWDDATAGVRAAKEVDRANQRNTDSGPDPHRGAGRRVGDRVGNRPKEN